MTQIEQQIVAMLDRKRQLDIPHGALAVARTNMTEPEYLDPRKTIPTRFLGKCDLHLQGCYIDLDMRTAWHAVSGWEKPRDAGGTNAIALRKPENRFACDNCIRRQQRGEIYQGSMFG